MFSVTSKMLLCTEANAIKLKLHKPWSQQTLNVRKTWDEHL